ncbi:MAG: cupin domain-containing protein [Myxococcota bacterium]|nr:cupin domain-containing protein [Myxococcota bacterium]
MTTRRDAELLEYALGVLPEAQRAELERELRASPEAASALGATEAALEALALAGDDATPSPALRANLLAATDDGAGRYEGFVGRLCALFDLDAARVREHLAQLDAAPDGAQWERGGMPGLALYHLDGGPGVADADCGLVHQAPDLEFPRHGHSGDEWALILDGVARADSGAWMRPGDLLHQRPGSVHSFRSVGERPLVYAIVLHGRIEIGGG